MVFVYNTETGPIVNGCLSTTKTVGRLGKLSDTFSKVYMEGKFLENPRHIPRFK